MSTGLNTADLTSISLDSSWWGALDRLLPPGLRDDVERRDRARLVLRFVALVTFLSIAMIPYLALTQPAGVVWVNIAYTILLLCTPWVLHRTGSIALAGHFVIGTGACILTCESAVLGGVESGAYPWLAALPIAAMLMCGRHGGIIWGGLSALSVVAIAAAQWHGWITPQHATPQLMVAQLGLSTAALTLTIAGLGWIYEQQVQRMLARLRTERRRFEQAATQDSLTGLANRALFADCLRRSLARCRRDGTSAALVYGDLDGFKRVNDELGHGAGDEVLRELAARMHAQKREGDVVARMGGDEFAILIESVSKREDALTFARNLLTALEEPLTIQGCPLRMKMSVGIAIFPDLERPGDDVDDLLKRADAAMYRAKRSGSQLAFADDR